MTIQERILIRKPGADTALLAELIQTTQDRIMLRYPLLLNEWPVQLDSVAVEIVAALYNQHQVNHEGVKTENVDAFSIAFVDDIIGQYDAEIRGHVARLSDADLSRLNVVRFL